MAAGKKSSFEGMVGTDGAVGAVVEDDDFLARNRTQVDMSGRVTFDDDEVSAPLARLAQGQTPEVLSNEAKAGTWLVTGYDPMEEITIIPLTVARTRDYSVGEGDDRSSLCYSPDGRTGHGDPGGDCKTCPMAEWKPNPKMPGKNLPPLCSQIWSYNAYCLELGTIVAVRFKKTSTTTAQLINSQISVRGTGTFAVKLGSRKGGEERRSYYVPTARIVTGIDAETYALARALMGMPDPEPLVRIPAVAGA